MVTSRHLAVVCIALTACPTRDSDGGSGPTTITDASTGAGECPEGSTACPCHVNGTCAPGLECDAADQICVMKDCDAGTLDCPCYEGDCLADLVCESGTCHAPESTTTEGSTTFDPGSTSAAESTESGASECDSELDCDACTQCVAVVDDECGTIVSDCLSDPDCFNLFSCCVDNFGTCSGCCQETVVPFDTWIEVAICVDQTCTTCGGWEC